MLRYRACIARCVDCKSPALTRRLHMELTYDGDYTGLLAYPNCMYDGSCTIASMTASRSVGFGSAVAV